MPELMGDIGAEPKPGTALRTMVKEHRHLDEFMAMVKAKMELDEKHLSGLKTLRDSWSPEWNGSGIWPLISQLLIHINNEITEREKAVTELNSCFAALPDRPHPNAAHEDGFNPLETLERVETGYYRYKQSHEAIRAPGATGELKAWLDAANLPDSFALQEGLKRSLILPKCEIEYRRAVVTQQRTVKHAIKWQADILSDALERHQQRAEDVKSFLNVVFTCYSSNHFNLSTSCSNALNSNRAFSSSKFIAPRHDETGNEASHALLQVVEYRNYIQGGEVIKPIFGLGVKMTVSLINELLNNQPYLFVFLSPYEDWVRSFFAIEKAVTRSELSAVLEDSRKESIETLVPCAFLLDEPLLPLPENVITQYRNGISRANLSNVMSTHFSFARREVVTLIVHFGHMALQHVHSSKDPVWTRMAIYLCHNAAAAGIIGSIWRKWDIENDCSLPEGVERVWDEDNKKTEVVWKKGGKPYYAPRSGLSS